MSLLVAMTIDYSLFILTRYREQLLAGMFVLFLVKPEPWLILEGDDTYRAVERVLETAGHTIFVSGTTLIVCFLGLVVLPLNMMQSLGIACSITLFLVMTINLSLAPCLLLTFPNFFARYGIEFIALILTVSRCVQPFETPCGTIKWGSIENEQPEDDDLSGTHQYLVSVNSTPEGSFVGADENSVYVLLLFWGLRY